MFSQKSSIEIETLPTIYGISLDYLFKTMLVLSIS